MDTDRAKRKTEMVQTAVSNATMLAISAAEQTDTPVDVNHVCKLAEDLMDLMFDLERIEPRDQIGIDRNAPDKMGRQI